MNHQTDTHPNRRILIVVSLLLAALTTAVFWEAQYYDFTGVDDDQYVYEHEHVLAGLSPASLRSAFTDIVAANWSPVTMLSLMLDTTLFGTDPGVYHRTAVFLHVVNTVLLFLVLQMLTKGLWPSAFVAALFALHPLHVEPVLWISSRKDVLSTFFLFAVFWAYARYIKAPSRSRHAAVIVLYALGLLTKPMLVTLPFVLLLLDYWPLNRYGDTYDVTLKRAVALAKEKIPLFALTFVFIVVTIIAQSGAGAVRSAETVPFSLRLLNLSPTYVTYMLKTFWPTDMSPIGYSIPYDTGFWKFTAATLLLLAITAAAILLRKRAPYLPVGWFYFLGTMVPVIGIVTVGSALRTDRYTYISLLGLFIMVAWGAPDLARRWRLDRRFLIGAAAITIAVYTALTWRQIPHWENAKTMFTQMLAVDKNNIMANYGIGRVYEEEGDYAKVIVHYQKALPGVDNQFVVLMTLGRAHFNVGEYANSVKAYRSAAKMQPSQAGAYYGVGIAHKAMKNYPDAERHLAHALELNPDHPLIQKELESVRRLRAGGTGTP